MSVAVLSLALCGASPAAAQEDREPELRGTVVSTETGEVVAGAWIGLEGEDWGTVSWNDGHFQLPEIPGRPATYDVRALGYESEVLTLDPSAEDQVIELTPDPEMQEGLRLLMDQLERRRHRGGDLRYFDRQDLAFSGAYSFGDLLARHGVRPRRVCLNEVPEPVGLLVEESHLFFLVESFGPLLRVYTEDFLEAAARERYRLQRLPGVCSAPERPE
jgi:hypothetical protein